MGEIQDMLDSRPMPEPEWPKCPRCDTRLVERLDPHTGKPIHDHGRAMMECPDCHEVSIRPEPRRQFRRFHLVRVVLAIATFMALAANILTRWFGTRGEEGARNLRVTIPLMMAVGIAVSLHQGLYCAALALSPNNPAGARLNWWAYTIFWAAAIALSSWTLYAIWPVLAKAPHP